MKMKRLIAVVAILFLAVVATVLFFLRSENSYREQVILPTEVYEVFALTDSAIGGASTSEISLQSQAVVADINVRSGVAYAYAGMGVNLLSVRHKPAADFFDFSKYDSIAVDVSAERLRTVEIRIYSNDPVYSVGGNYLSYRPQVKTVPANGVTKMALTEFRTPEWWLSMVGLENDDYLSYFERGVFVAILNGEGALRGIPDQIRVNSIKLWSGHSGS